MKNEVMLERCLKMAKALNERETMCYNFALEHNDPDGLGLGSMLGAMVIALKADIAAEECRAAGKSSPLKAANRIIKNAKKCNSREYTHGSWMSLDGMQCYCDGYHGVRLHNPLPTEKIHTNEMPIDLGRIVNSAKDNAGARLNLPSVAELKAHIKFQKAVKKANRNRDAITYEFGDNLPAVNAEYLLNMLELLPECKARAAKNSPLLGTIYFEAEAGDGVLLPVRKRD